MSGGTDARARELHLRRALGEARTRMKEADRAVEDARYDLEEACGRAALGDEGEPVEEAEARLDAAEREARRTRAAVSYLRERVPTGAGAAL